MRGFASLLILAIAVWSGAQRPVEAAAQSVDATVEGVIADGTRAVVPGATVTLLNVESGLLRSVTTDAAGRYRVAVPPGTYDVRVQRDGFRPESRRQQPMHVGATVTLNVVLEQVTRSDALEVAGTAETLHGIGTAVSRLVAREEIDTLPVIDRNFNVLATLAPGVTATGAYGGVDISGSRDFQNGYNVDGVSAEGLGAGEQRLRYAQDWIREFQVLTSRYNVEFGRASGGVLNAIMRSGSNVTAGRAYAFFRHHGWDATPAFATTKPALDAKRLGGTAGGKLIRDRLFYFGGFEWLDDEANRVVNSSFQEFNGSIPAASDQKLHLVKAEHHSAAQSFRARLNGERTSSTNVGVGGVATEQHGSSVRYRAHEVSGGWSRIAGASVFNEIRAALTATMDDRGCNVAERNPAASRFTLVYAGAQLGCPATGYGRKDTGELQVIENISWARGRHDLKAGTSVSRGRSSGDYRFLRDGQYRFTHNRRFDLNDPASYPTFFVRFEGDTAWSYPRWSWSVFVQDSWRFVPDVTLNAGVRYDFDGTYSALNELRAADNGLGAARSDRDNLAPRADAAWRINGGNTVVRGGAGVYYDENHGNVATLLLFNQVLVRRAMLLNELVPEPALFSTPAALRRYLAEALARNDVPEMLGVGATAALDPDLQVPYTVQTSAGIARTWRWVSAAGDLVYARGLDQYVIRDVNLDRTAALAPTGARIERPDRRYGQINRYDNGGSFEYRALHLQANVAASAEHVLRASYTWARNDSNTRTLLEGAAPGFAATNPFDLSEDFGPADHDVRHVFTASWLGALPFGVHLSGLVTARSGRPWNVTLVQLPRTEDPDPFLDRLEPRNSRRGDGFFSLDVRLSKTLRFAGHRAATVFVEAFNATNATNLTGYLNIKGTETFGQPTSASERRRLQIGLRIDLR